MQSYDFFYDRATTGEKQESLICRQHTGIFSCSGLVLVLFFILFAYCFYNYFFSMAMVACQVSALRQSLVGRFMIESEQFSISMALYEILVVLNVIFGKVSPGWL